MSDEYFININTDEYIFEIEPRPDYEIDLGEQGPPGPPGNGITSITKTSSQGGIDTYTIYYTNGNTSTFQVPTPLIAGANIQIEDNVISATDTIYIAGEGISIEDNVISNTQTSAEWGNIDGNIEDQVDLNDLIDSKVGEVAGDLSLEETARINEDTHLQGNIDTLSSTVSNNYTTLNGKIGNNKTSIDNHKADKNNPHEVTKSQVGLGNVDNTSDANKPVSTAQQTALDGKVDKLVIKPTAGTYTKVSINAEGQVTSGTTLSESDIPNLHLIKVTDVTSTATEVNQLHESGVIKSDFEKLHAITSTATELNYVDGVTSSIQTQLDGKIDKNTDITSATKCKITYDSNGLVTEGADLQQSDIPALNLSKISDVTASVSEVNILDGATISTTELNVLDGITASTTELNYIDGATSSIQEQLNGKQPTITGGATTITSNNLTTARALISDTNGKVDVSNITTTELGYLDGVTSNIQGQIGDITDLIPADATISNKLADKEFVNSSISTNTAKFIGTFIDVPTLEAYSGTVTNNDYAFVVNSVITNNGSDWTTFNDLDAYDKSLVTNFDYAWVINGSNFDLYRFDILSQEWGLRVSNTQKTSVTLNNAYNRYKATVSGSTVIWGWEYTLNNSSFTAAQWAAINSLITADTKVTHTANTAVGNSTTPVYVGSNGAVSPINYTIEKSVPSNAEFTDTTYTFATGSTDGTIAISVDGGTPSDVSVCGLGSAAYTHSTDYATASQGSKADTAIQSVTTGSTNGTISVDSSDVSVYGLGSAAYTNSSSYATSSQGTKADSAIQSVKVNGSALTPDANKAVDITAVTSVNNVSPVNGNVTISTSDITNDSNFIANTSTGSSGLTILGTANTQTGAINIGQDSTSTNSFATAIGYSADATASIATAVGCNATASGSSATAVGQYTTASGMSSTAIGDGAEASSVISTAMGAYAKATNAGAIQIGMGTNNAPSTLAVGFGTNKEYQLLNGVTGLIPDERLSSNIARTSDLSTVATSGSYNDLTNKPTIPEAQVNSDWNASSGVAQILNKPSLSTVATTGDYNDLTNKPTIPTVGNGTITFTQGGATKGTITTNQSVDATIALDAGGGTSTDVQINGTSIVSSDVANIVTEGTYNASTNKIATMSELEGKQDVLTAGASININYTPPLPTVDTRSTATVQTVGSTDWQEIAYGNGIWIAVGKSGYMCINNGTSWGTPFTVGSKIWRGIVYGNGIWVAVGDGAVIGTSTDNGATWTTQTLGGTTRNWVDVIFVNNTFYAVKSNGYFTSSADGSNWVTPVQTGNTNYTYNGMDYGNGIFVLVCNSGNIIVSTNGGSTWTSTTVGSNNWLAATYALDKFIIAGGSGYISYSSDGATWETPFAVGNKTWQELRFGGNYVVVIGEGGNSSASLDGTTWSLPVQIAGGSNNWNGLAYGNGKFVCDGAGNVVTSFELSQGQEGGTFISTVVDDALSPTSENPVQNKVIYEILHNAGLI